jgi:hypothetical protein
MPALHNVMMLVHTTYEQHCIIITQPYHLPAHLPARGYQQLSEYF